ncbi:SusC/RagA family TonB-linked outer membrane protein [Alistipes sp. OttesenSCG-928-B03]|nr:SusC/RagA family TonB-linked outer membrane protein [Alistipes sp. OttesenSCG-928-B03]
MRLKIVVLLCSIGTLTAGPSFSQQQKFDVSYQRSSLVSVLNDLKDKTGYHFVYFDGVVVPGNVTVTTSMKDATIEKILDEVLVKNGFTYRMGESVIAIGKVAPAAQAQPGKTITGRVINKANKQAIPGVSVVVAGTQTGAATDATGNYRITTTANDPTLVFSFLGMKKQEVKIGDKTVINIEMEEDVHSAGEVTVIAYGTRDKRELITSVSSVKAADIDDLPAASIETLLQGQMAGVEVSNISGSPGGGGSAVRVRGYNSLMDGSSDAATGLTSATYANVRDGSPLYVIDGVPVNSSTYSMTGTNMLAEIDPSTIASVEVLKDAASAALYGSRASAGVVLITTKQGQTGRTRITANASYSYSVLPATPTQIIGHGERQYYLNAYRNHVSSSYWNRGDIIPESYWDAWYESRDPNVQYDYFWNKGNAFADNLSTLAPLTDSLNSFYNNNSNFWKTTFRLGQILNANVSASGGSENVRYMVGAGVYDEMGIMYGSDFTRYSLNSNLTATPYKNLKLDTRMYVAYTERASGAANTSLSTARKYESLTASPTSTSSLLPSTGVVADNILRNINESSSKATSLRLRASVNASYTIMPGLSISTMLADDYAQSHMNAFSPSSYSSIWGNQSSGSWEETNIFTNENFATFSKALGLRHNLEVLAGTSYMRESKNTMQGYGRNGASDYVHYVDSSWPSLYYNNGTAYAAQSYRSNFWETKMMSYLARVAYNFDKKYLMEVTFRRDGSSTFGEDVRWANFPSVAVGWNFSDENFMRDFWWLSFGKLRYSWGRTGQTFADPYLAHGTWTTGNIWAGYSGVSPSSPLNSKLTWEKSDQHNAGIDIDLFDNRLRVKADYYYKYSSSVLNAVNMPGNFFYHKAAFRNVMEISNQGFEVEATYDIFKRGKPVQWRVKLNISRNWNRLEKTDTGSDLTRGQSLLVIGRPIYGLYVYKDKGIVQNVEDIPTYWTNMGYPVRLKAGGQPYQVGMRLYEDMNMDGKIGEGDQYYAQSTLPAATGGISSDITWNGFDMNFMFYYTIGKHMINNYAYSALGYTTGSFGPLLADPSDYTVWRNPGDGNTDFPAIYASNQSTYGSQYSASSNDSRIEKVNFLRLKQLTIGYSLPKNIMQKIKVDGMRIYFTAENLFLLSNYSGVDPEVVSPYSGYDNFDNYPLARKLTIGLTVNF